MTLIEGELTLSEADKDKGGVFDLDSIDPQQRYRSVPINGPVSRRWRLRGQLPVESVADITRIAAMLEIPYKVIGPGLPDPQAIVPGSLIQEELDT